MDTTRSTLAAPRTTANPRSTVRLLGYPLHPLLAQFPFVCFIGALVTDLAYAGSANIMWSNFSNWLISAGLLMGGLATVAGLIDFIADRQVRAVPLAGPYMVLGLSVLVIELVNAFVHNRDGWTSVVPTGLTLSIIAVILSIVCAWLGASLTYKHRVGVQS